MSESSELTVLERAHTPEAIRLRMERPPDRSYLSDGVLGSIDGCVTTFAVVAGAVGGALQARVIVMLGLVNLLADGFSMAASNYLSVRSGREEVERTRREEEDHIARVPDGEREEIRQIFTAKGFQEDILERIVEVICRNRRLWVDTMIMEEHHMQLVGRHPLRAGLATFGAFVLIGLMPLIPFFTTHLSIYEGFKVSALATAAGFFGIGMLKGRVLRRSMTAAGLETLLIGSAAAALAYGVGYLVRQLYSR